MEVLIIGSNFGFKAHFKAAKKIDLYPYSISSPNIQIKKISNNLLKYTNPIEAIKNYKRKFLYKIFIGFV